MELWRVLLCHAVLHINWGFHALPDSHRRRARAGGWNTGFAGAAAPPQYIGLDQLRSVLASSPGGIEGYFLTVPGGPSLGQQDPVQVKMTVKAVADGRGPDGR